VVTAASLKLYPVLASRAVAIIGLGSAQVALDLESLEKHLGRVFTAAEREEITTAQVRSYRWTFLVGGLEHPNFVKAVGELSPEGLKRFTELAAALSN